MPELARTTVDRQNESFWDELCGSPSARRLGVTDSDPASLRRFDAWYFEIYPYLERYIPFTDISGKRVMEVGLGYGSVAQRLAESGADYHGLDIAAGPVAMANQRLRQNDLPGAAVQGNVLECPFPDAFFDLVVAIGCYHHTGDLRGALDQTWRALKPGGRAVVMIYNAYSYRRWARWPVPTLRYWMWDRLSLGAPPRTGARERAAYDSASDGDAAPETVFTSTAHLRRLTACWSSVTIARENIGGELFLRLIDRDVLLRTLGPSLGLDLYCRLEK